MVRIYVPSLETVRERIRFARKKTIKGRMYYFYTSYYSDSTELAFDMAESIRKRGWRAKVVINKRADRKYEVWVSPRRK